MNRRTLLAALPAAAVVPGAALAEAETPVEATYRQIIHLRSRINDETALTDDEGQALCRDMFALADNIVDMPSQGPMDFIFKLMGHTTNGDHDTGECPDSQKLWAEARALIG